MSGVVVACGLFLTYGAAPLLLVPLGVVVATRSWNLVPAAVAGAAVVVVGFLIAGFWWFDGVEPPPGASTRPAMSRRRRTATSSSSATRRRWPCDRAGDRSRPSPVLRDRRLWVLVGCGARRRRRRQTSPACRRVRSSGSGCPSYRGSLPPRPAWSARIDTRMRLGPRRAGAGGPGMAPPPW